MTTTITLIIPTYNLGSYFAGMLGALQRQTRPFDLWLVDDGSTDDTANQAEAFTRGIPNFHHFAFPQHQGVSAARNYGLARATTQAVAFIDGDDLIAEDFVQALATALSPAVSAVAVGYRWFRTPSAATAERRLDQAAMFEQVSHHGTAIGGYVWNKAFRRAAITAANLQFDPTLQLAEDYWFTASFVARTPGPYVYLPAVRYTKRNRPNSTIHRAGFQARAQEDAVFERIRRLREELGR